MAEEFEKWKVGNYLRSSVVYTEQKGIYICMADTPELAAQIVREHNFHTQMFEALIKIRDEENNNPCGCENHTGEDCCANTTYHCPECIAGAALALAAPQRGKDGQNE